MSKSIFITLTLLSGTIYLAAETPAPVAAPAAADRAAILAMAGEFTVNFTFQETAQLIPNYTPVSEPYSETAKELVVIAEDMPQRISLQHLLIMEGGPIIKHWAQIWTYQDTRVLEYQGENVWTLRDLPAAAVAGTWTQLVTQIDDSPRYESWGQWQHEGGVSSWVSQDTHRPLPRREHTKRKDYNVLEGYNRQTLTAAGWLHEQWNTKAQHEAGTVKFIARETGLNTYTRQPGPEFQEAKDFWAKEGDFWRDVRTAWEQITATRDRVQIYDKTDQPTLRRAVVELKKSAAEGRVAAITAVIQPFLTAETVKTAAQ
jgi:hypothetical protein